MPSLLLGACSGSERSTGGKGDIGGTVIVSTAADANTMLPPLISGITEREVLDLVFDHLADIGDDLNTVGDKGFSPRLAKSWDWSADSLSITFHINPAARWHDGKPVTAGDVQYSFQLNRDPAMGSPVAPLITNIDSVSVKDSLTAVAWFKRRVPEQFYDLVYQVHILPKHVLGGTPVAQLKTAEIARQAIGTGRFRLANWDAGKRIELVADTANYRGRAKLDRIVFVIAPDFNGAATRFLAGDADVFENLRVEQVGQLAHDTVRQVIRLPSLGFTYLAFNAKDPKSATRPHPVLGERAVRRALSMAVDRRAMLKNVFDTIGVYSWGPFPRQASTGDTTVTQIPFDTVRARALLDSAGWKAGADGIRVKNGVRLAFSITTPNSSSTRHAYSVLVQEAMHRVGADVKIDELDYPGYIQKLGSHAFDAEMASFVNDPSVAGFKQIFATEGIGKDGNNYYQYSSPVVDALLDSATTTFDVARRNKLTRRAFETIIDDAPAIWLYEPPARAGIDRRIHAVGLRPDNYFAGMAEWWIPADKRNARDGIGLHPAH